MQVSGTQVTLPSPESYSQPAQPPMCLLCTHVGARAVGWNWDAGSGWLQHCTLQTAMH